MLCFCLFVCFMLFFIVSLQASIVHFMDQKFESITSTNRALKQLHRFENLNLPNMPIDEKYKFILQLYSRDLDMVAKMYRNNRLEPIIARNMPPVAGKIAWAQQLYRRINQPMEVFKKQGTCLEAPEAKRIIRNYNKLAKVLVEYQILYHRGWLRQVSGPLSIYMAHVFLIIVTSSVLCYKARCKTRCFFFVQLIYWSIGVTYGFM